MRPRSFPTSVTHKSALRLVVEPLAIAIVLALTVRMAMRLYVIPSASMMPTLVPGDHIVVTPYRFSSRPKRGDVIVFRSIRAADALMIKRVVGTPGDLVEARAGRLIVSGHAVPEPYVASQAATGSINPQIIPADAYFVLGDNRSDSLDSRSWGVLPRDRVIGRARMILWSSHAQPDDGGSNMASARSSATGSSRPADGHPSRFFKLIQ
jgi:signal peptidase I